MDQDAEVIGGPAWAQGRKRLTAQLVSEFSCQITRPFESAVQAGRYRAARPSRLSPDALHRVTGGEIVDRDADAADGRGRRTEAGTGHIGPDAAADALGGHRRVARKC